MILYHGTNVLFDEIDLSCGVAYKDFGKGFYLTPNIETARRMAIKRAKLSGGDPVLMTYVFDESAHEDSSLKIKTFAESLEWIEFILLNRDKSYKGSKHDYDIIIGPIANDGVAYLLGRWNEGTIELNEMLKQLRGRYLDIQYYFGTESALKFLKLNKRELI